MALNEGDANNDGKLSVAEAKNVTELYVVNNKVASLEGISWLPNLESLTVQNCGLKSVHSDLGKLTKLKTLNLSYNKISSLSNAAVTNLKLLENVDLSGNKLTALPTGAKNWTKAKKLDLSGNAMTQIPTGSIPYMKALTTLNLANNALANNTSALKTKLDKLKSLTKLTTLDLSGNKLTAFPTTPIGAMTKLQYLYLQKNSLTSIPSTIGKLTALKVLDASDNKITKLDAAISKCTKITKMNLANNKLKTIPSLKALTKLKCTGTDYYALNLCGNSISQTNVRKYTNTVLTSAWVKRQKTTKFVPITSIKATTNPIFAIPNIPTDLSGSFTFNPTNASYKTVKYVVETCSDDVKASLNGSILSVTKTNKTAPISYVIVKVVTLDGSQTVNSLYVPVLPVA